MKANVKAVRDVLKQDHKLSYRKIKRVPFQGNSERCKVLRSLYAQKMLPIYETSQRVINIDESWLNEADFRGRRWKGRGMLNTASDKVFSQRINIIAAIASDGDMWVTLTTCNTNSEVMMLFITRLACELTKQRKDWRNDTVFLLDGVSQLDTSNIVPS